MDLLRRLEEINTRWEDVGELLTDPNILSDMKRYAQLNKEYKNLEEIIMAYRQYRDLLSNIDTNKKIISEEKDEEFRNLAKSELDDLLAQVDPMEEEIKLMLVPADPMDDRNAIVEIRAGAGGD